MQLPGSAFQESASSDFWNCISCDVATRRLNHWTSVPAHIRTSSSMIIMRGLAKPLQAIGKQITTFTEFA